VGRIDNVRGDRNLICTCPPATTYEESEAVVIEPRSARA
jgi:hypothetical protein